MKLWTVQPVEAINIIEKTGAFTCDETKSDKDFRKAYEWIAKEMDKRQITHPKDLTLPLWAWHTRDWKHKKPDGMDLELRYSHSYGWDRHLPDQFNAEKMGDRLSGRTWTGQPFDIWNPRIQRSFFALRSVSFSSFVSFC